MIALIACETQNNSYFWGFNKNPVLLKVDSYTVGYPQRGEYWHYTDKNILAFEVGFPGRFFNFREIKDVILHWNNLEYGSLYLCRELNKICWKFDDENIMILDDKGITYNCANYDYTLITKIESMTEIEELIDRHRGYFRDEF